MNSVCAFLILVLIGLCVSSQDNSKEITANCKELFDQNVQCEGWHSLGYCEEDTLHYHRMQALCPSLCAGCGFNPEPEIEKCLVLQDHMEQCRLWTLVGHCSLNNPYHRYMMEQCPYSCAGCVQPAHQESHKCATLTDYSEKCRIYAERGWCTEPTIEPGFMETHCAYSCAGCLKEVCGVARDLSGECAQYRSNGWCQQSSVYYQDILNDCQYTCNDCDSTV